MPKNEPHTFRIRTRKADPFVRTAIIGERVEKTSCLKFFENLVFRSFWRKLIDHNVGEFFGFCNASRQEVPAIGKCLELYGALIQNLSVSQLHMGHFNVQKHEV